MKTLFLLLSSLVLANAATCLVWAPPVYVDGEFPTGARDGKNRVFTLAHTPASGSVPQVVLNGLMQRMGAANDYTLTGAVITFTPQAAIPQSANDNLLVWYRYQP